MNDRERSGLEEAVARVGDRWSLLLIDALLDGPRRFGELQDDVPGVASNILSARLKALDREGVVVASPYSQRPLRYSYELSERGRELAGALRLLAQWGARCADTEGPRHDTCGASLEARWFCPTCDRVVDDTTEDELGYA